jgi:hypothetical protein
VTEIDAIKIALAYGYLDADIRRQVGDLIAAYGAWHRGIARELVRVPGPRVPREVC